MRLFLLLFCAQIYASEASILTLKLAHLQKVYPDCIASYDERTITWQDGTVMPLFDGCETNKTMQDRLNNPSLADQLLQDSYVPGEPAGVPITDPGRIRYLPFFCKMYGESKEEVAAKVKIVKWMPAVFVDEKYELLVTTVNGVSDKIQKISDELEALIEQYPEHRCFVKDPAQTFAWRYIDGTNRLSAHSFGMTIDIAANAQTKTSGLTHYWLWDLREAGMVDASESTAPLVYRNLVPFKVIAIFEKYGFIWGGKWKHYDTMHFEYRPELFPPDGLS